MYSSYLDWRDSKRGYRNGVEGGVCMATEGITWAMEKDKKCRG